MWVHKFLAVTVLMAAAVTPICRAEENQGDPGDDPAKQVAAGGQPLPVVRADIDVVGDLPETPAITVLDTGELTSGPARGAGDLLRAVPGVSSSRMGGHGLDPRIRGLGESSIRVLIDGAEIHGGCPNRMDPPSSYAAVESFDAITTVRGVQTLRYGAAPGTVLFEREPVHFTDDSWWRVGVNAVAGSFYDGPAFGFTGAVGTERYSVEASADRLAMDNYKDGNGDEIASAFDSRNGLLGVTWTPDAVTSLRLSYDVNRTRDALYAGAGMDSPYSDNDTVRVAFQRGAGTGALGEIRANVYSSDVDHLMDNYSLREWTAPMAMRAPSSSDSSGGRAWADLNVTSNLVLTVGVDIARNQRQAQRYAGPNPENVTALQSVLWPDVDIDQDGLFLEGNAAVGRAGRLRFGVRGDRHSASAGAADVKPSGMNPTPRQLWQSYYGEGDDSWSTDDVGAFVRYEHRLAGGGFGYFAGVSRAARAADTTQRYMAGNSMSPSMRWAGNPDLDLAVHSQIDAGLSWSSSAFSLDATVFYDDVDDEILRDRAHGQPGILKDDNATVYRNIDARRVGGEVVARWRVSAPISIGGDAAYVYAQNTTDDRPIAQTPPLEGRVYATWTAGRWGASGIVRMAAKQTRVDDDPLTGSGLDVGDTPGWAVGDLSGEVDLGVGFTLLAGLDNVFDRAYAYHLNRDNLFDPGRVQVNEPGRVFWIRLRWSGEG